LDFDSQIHGFHWPHIRQERLLGSNRFALLEKIGKTRVLTACSQTTTDLAKDRLEGRCPETPPVIILLDPFLG